MPDNPELATSTLKFSVMTYVLRTPQVLIISGSLIVIGILLIICGVFMAQLYFGGGERDHAR